MVPVAAQLCQPLQMRADRKELGARKGCPCLFPQRKFQPEVTPTLPFPPIVLHIVKWSFELQGRLGNVVSNLGGSISKGESRA